MTLKEMILQTGQLPTRGVMKDGTRFEIDTVKNNLNYCTSMWQIAGFNVKDHIINFGTGSTPEASKEALKSKILKA